MVGVARGDWECVYQPSSKWVHVPFANQERICRERREVGSPFICFPSNTINRLLEIYMDVRYSNCSKEQLIFFHRHYFNIYPVQRPINSSAICQGFPILVAFSRRIAVKDCKVCKIPLLITIEQFFHFFYIQAFFF